MLEKFRIEVWKDIKDINDLSKEEFENLEEIFFIKFCKKVLTNIIRCCIIYVVK